MGVRYMSKLLICFIGIACIINPHSLNAQQRHFPDTASGIHVFSDQLQTGMTTAQQMFAANRLAGCQKMLLSDVEGLRRFNPNFIVLHYQLGCGNGPAPFIDGNEWVSDWNYVTTRDGWFMRKDGQRLHMARWDWYLMDIADGGYREYWVEKCIERMRDTECDGVFTDSFTVDAYFGQLTPEHPWFTDTNLCRAHWIPLLEAYADHIQARFAATPERFYFLPNIGALITGWDATDYAWLSEHGGMVEGFGAWGGGSYFDEADWRLQMDRILELVSLDRIVICQSYPSDFDLQERMFLTGCYLLIKGNRTYLNMLGLEHGEELVFYPEYEVPIGSYLGGIPSSTDELRDLSSGCYRRDYSNGIVFVNPGGNPLSTGDLGETYQLVSAWGGGAVHAGGGYVGGLSYSAVSGVDLQPHSAAILLRNLPSTIHSVALTLDGGSFTNAESLTLHWRIEPAESGSARADAYVAVLTPSGKLYFYDGGFGEAVRPVARSMAVNARSGSLGPFPLAGLPTGRYTWYAALVVQGADPLSNYNWVSNLAGVDFMITSDALNHSHICRSHVISIR